MPDLRPLPPLREDLHLHEAANNPDGSPAWTIQDPISNQFFRIGWLEFALLSRWHLGTQEAVLASVQAETLLDPSEEELAAVLQFLQQNQLLAIHAPQYTQQLLQMRERARGSRLKWLLHHYLFFRIPLWHPDRLLQRALPWVNWIYRPSTALVITALTLAGLVLTFRQWDVFTATFRESLSPTGLVSFLIALAVAKSLHELGHAFTSTRYGVRVAHMGVAFVVLWPMLYTDTGESWRLRDPRKRLAIASAGIITELSLAGLATLAWNLTETGDVRQALFYLATTSWLIMLGINASPFLRFDGYFILSDLLDMPNLHERSFAQARTWLRHRLLGWDDAYPEEFSPGRRRMLIAFAFLVWLYRFVVFLGIAIAVYLFFFKLLGIFLFLVEIAWFILRPIWSELKVWHERRGEIPPRRRFQLASGLVLLLLVGLIPWNPQIRAEGWAHAKANHVFYSPLAAQLVSLPDAPGHVANGTPVFSLDQPELAYRAQLAQEGAQALDQQLSGLMGLPDGEERRLRIQRELALREAESHAQLEERNRLILRAPYAGEITDIDPELRPGVWVEPQQPLAYLVDPSSWQVEAYLRQNDIDRIEAGSRVRFYPQESPESPMTGAVLDIERTRTEHLPHPLLSAQHGGRIPVLPESQGLTPREALYRVRIQLDAPPAARRVLSGEAVIDGTPRSWLGEVVQAALVVLIREASF